MSILVLNKFTGTEASVGEKHPTNAQHRTDMDQHAKGGDVEAQGSGGGPSGSTEP